MKIIKCERCGCEIGRCTEYVLYTGNMDTTDPEWNDEYGGDFDGENLCVDCYHDAILKEEAEEYEEDIA